MIGLQWRKQAISKKGWKKIAWKIWRNLTQEHLDTLYKSIPCHMQAGVDAQDRYKKYWMFFTYIFAQFWSIN